MCIPLHCTQVKKFLFCLKKSQCYSQSHSCRLNVFTCYQYHSPVLWVILCNPSMWFKSWREEERCDLLMWCDPSVKRVCVYFRSCWELVKLIWFTKDKNKTSHWKKKNLKECESACRVSATRHDEMRPFSLVILPLCGAVYQFVCRKKRFIFVII